MKKIILLSLLLSAAFLLAACSKNNSDEDPGPTGKAPNWEKPLIVTESYGTGTYDIRHITTYTYDEQGRLLGYQKKDSRDLMREEMLNSQYSGNIHTYEVHSYEWIGGSLPVVFLHTDTYIDDSFTVLEKQVRIGRNMDIKETLTYHYYGGKLINYRMDNEGSYPEIYTTELIYRTGTPSKETFPTSVSGNIDLRDIIYEDENGFRTGYYTENDHNNSGHLRVEWDFKYTDEGCTFYRESVMGTRQVHVVFYPEAD